jgi:iron complex outermembrane receptor protein
MCQPAPAGTQPPRWFARVTTPYWVISLALGQVAAVRAQATDETVVVTATRSAQSALDLPVAIDRVERGEIQQGQLQVNLSESLDAVPGASVENRQNYAQDLQISVRGFGARSSFGVRGVRLYADGIPGTMPDGQGQFSQFDLGSADRIEVLRGPFSALYGNSSGGVIAIFTQDGPPGSEIDATAAAGSFGTRRYAVKTAGTHSNLNYVVDAAHFGTDGYRDHGAAQRDNFNAKLRFDLGNSAQLTLIANAVAMPSAQDPLGLTQAQLANPSQAGTNALLYNTRKSLNQQQAGAIYDRKLGDELDLSATIYAGHRATTQYQAILTSAESTLTSPGGVIDLGRVFWGTDIHATDVRSIAGTLLQLTAGVTYDDLNEARRGYLNFIGTTLGVEGALRRQERNEVFDLDQYLQAQWDPNPKWRLLTGLRYSLIDVSSDNRLAIAGVPVETGVRYAATNPVAGVTYRAAPDVSLYASYGRGFETPTLNDLAYRSVNGNPPGLNIALQPARSSNYELGVKRAGPRLTVDVTGFYTDTHDELAVLQNSGGRAVYQNIGATERRGAEFGLTELLGGGLSTRLAYTWLRAVVAQPYVTCIALPCLPSTVPVGSRLPAVPENSLYGALAWHPMRWGLAATLEIIGRAQIFANDLNTQAASGYWVENLKVGFEQTHDALHFSEFARIDNLADRRYVDSIIVNESSGRYFEPEPGRAFYLMFSASHR